MRGLRRSLRRRNLKLGLKMARRQGRFFPASGTIRRAWTLRRAGKI